MRIDEHFGSRSSSIFKHLNDSGVKIKPQKKDSFKILDNAKTDYVSFLKEGFYINWLNVVKK